MWGAAGAAGAAGAYGAGAYSSAYAGGDYAGTTPFTGTYPYVNFCRFSNTH